MKTTIALFACLCVCLGMCAQASSHAVVLDPSSTRHETLYLVTYSPCTITAQVVGVECSRGGSLVVRDEGGDVLIATAASVPEGQTDRLVFTMSASDWAFSVGADPGEWAELFADVFVAGQGVPLPFLNLLVRDAFAHGTETATQPAVASWYTNGVKVGDSETVKHVDIGPGLSGTVNSTTLGIDLAPLGELALFDWPAPDGIEYVAKDGDWVPATAAGGSADMIGASNLSDVASASTSRENLGLGTAATNPAAAFATAAQGALADSALQAETDTLQSVADRGNTISEQPIILTKSTAIGYTLSITNDTASGGGLYVETTKSSQNTVHGKATGFGGVAVIGDGAGINAIGVKARATGSGATALVIEGNAKQTSGTFALSAGASVTNISTTVNAASTDDQLPTAKGVYDYGQTLTSTPPATNTTTDTMTNQVNFPAGIQIDGVPITGIDTNGTIAANFALSANMTGLSGAATLVQWTDVQDDTHGGYDSPSSTYYAPAPGWYIHTVTFRLSGLDDGKFGQCIWYQAGDVANGVATVNTSSIDNNAVFQTPTLTRVTYAPSTNTYWHCEVAHNNGDTDPFLSAGADGARNTRWTIGYLGQ